MVEITESSLKFYRSIHINPACFLLNLLVLLYTFELL